MQIVRSRATNCATKHFSRKTFNMLKSKLSAEHGVSATSDFPQIRLVAVQDDSSAFGASALSFFFDIRWPIKMTHLVA